MSDVEVEDKVTLPDTEQKNELTEWNNEVINELETENVKDKSLISEIEPKVEVLTKVIEHKEMSIDHLQGKDLTNGKIPDVEGVGAGKHGTGAGRNAYTSDIRANKVRLEKQRAKLNRAVDSLNIVINNRTDQINRRKNAKF